MHATLADVIADTAQNSIEARAKNIAVTLVEDGSFISVTITDDGKGMDEAAQRKAFNPFYTEAGKHDKRKVGLGLPILKQLCESCEGAVSLESAPGKGTKLAYRLNARHIDLPPMGDLPEMVLTLFNYPGDFALTFTHVRGENEYTLTRSELAEAVGGLESIGSLAEAREMLAALEASLDAPPETEGAV